MILFQNSKYGILTSIETDKGNKTYLF